MEYDSKVMNIDQKKRKNVSFFTRSSCRNLRGKSNKTVDILRFLCKIVIPFSEHVIQHSFQVN